ncbi:cupin-like domain-containing protein [Pseudorhodoplanes sp.]|uniref:cupin-like domain-containing protein n=1 Tax=Pseudorhodoplanes sp. TaxID=1934341 RepID=UPI00391AB20A
MKFFEPTDAAALTQAFPHLPFALKHRFAGNPLLTLPKLAELVRDLPRDRLEYNSGKAAIDQRPETTPTVDLEPEEIVHNIETAGAWMVLKSVEQDQAYRGLIDEALMEVARMRGFGSLKAAGFEDIRGFIFVSSANSTTPFHADADENFFFQVHGDKYFHVYDNRDRSIASEEALETSAIKHRNLPYDPKFDARCTTYTLKPGDGVFVPYQWPHWVRTAGSYSISLSLTWKSKEVRRRNDIFAVNAMLRGVGLPQHPPGTHPMIDTAKIALFRAAAAAVEPLRKSETMRRTLRRIVKGKDANYYYRDPQKQPDVKAS